MAVVIRLQGLPVSAGSADIRHFFMGLTVPDGGVHIIGGEFGEAYIIFATDDDARRAMNRSEGVIKQSRIQLYLSSRSEMQSTIDMNRNRGREPKPVTRGYGSTNTDGAGDKNFSNVVASGKRINKTGPISSNCYNQSREAQPFDSDNLYLFLQGLPYSAGEEEVRTFFHGLHVDEMIFLQHRNGPFLGRKNGNSLVKFATRKDTLEGLKRHKQYIGTRFIDISKATKEQWRENSDLLVKDVGPANQHGDQSSSREQNSVQSKSPKNDRARSRSPHNLDFYVHIKNMSNIVEKKDVKSFFENLEISDDQIRFLYNSYYRTKDAFVQFKNEKDYRTALGLHKQILKNRMVYIYPIGRKSMLKLIENQSALKGKPINEYRPGNSFQNASSNPRFYIYIRNFPFDVTKSEVRKFFVGFSLNDDDIYLLYDDKGVGLGEALVMFHSEELVTHAENLNRRRFLGTEVLLQRISEAQLKEFGINPFPGESSDNMYHMNQYSHSGSSHAPSVRSFRAPDDFRYGPEEGRVPPKYFRGPHFGGNRFANRNNEIEGNPERRMRFDDDGDSTGPAVIQLFNIPFTTTVNEILDFFYGYRVIPDSVSIQYNESGFSTGFATVSIENAREAIAAVQELNDKPIGPRKIKLSLL